jgi:hypothetical protein
MRWKLFIRFLVIFWPIFLAGSIVTTIGNDLNWQWDRWQEAISLGSMIGTTLGALIAAALFVRLQPKAEDE